MKRRQSQRYVLMGSLALVFSAALSGAAARGQYPPSEGQRWSIAAWGAQVLGPAFDGGLLALAVGRDDHVLGLKTDNSIITWGPNDYGQGIVDRHHVHAQAGQRVQVHRQGRHQRLALAGSHLRDLAAVQNHAADQLHVEVPHVEDAAARLANHGKGFDEQIVGAKAGETRPAKVQMAADHPNEQLRGQEISFDVTVKEVRTPKPR